MPSGVWRLLAASLSDPMLWFLVVSAGLFARVGERSEAVVLPVAIAPLLGMDAFLHGRTQTPARPHWPLNGRAILSRRPSITIPNRSRHPTSSCSHKCGLGPLEPEHALDTCLKCS